MPNQIADFMRNEIKLRDDGLKLGISPRQYSDYDLRIFFLRAADEIDRLDQEKSAAEWMVGNLQQQMETDRIARAT